ncbi:MAG: class I tRNA ligase family protein, partial [Elusimicrobiota bacterium]|nr:class I tRNA ligase family protein [Elusimicrobiota bacterium]
EEAGLLVKEEKYDNAVSTCYRCGNAIEPFLSEQWFVKMDNLAAPAIKAVESGAVQMHPESWKTPLLNWLKNIQDWCISRQIWWGHRIPVWYCRKCCGAGLTFAEDKLGREHLVKVAFEDGAQPILSQTQPACPHCGGKDTVQDPDVLDTWFSSGLWPFSVFGWPKETGDLKHYYPTSVLVTGYEIIYLWVARMIMMGIEFMGKPPFPHVFLNGIVRDKTGKKMSKSLGNVVDPLDLIKKYGADATRFSLLMQAAPGKDIPYGEDSVVGARNFCNKIYNAARFIQMNLEGIEKLPPLPEKPADIFDGYIINYYRHCAANAAAAIEEYEFSKAAGKLYKFFWNDFCDWYIEIAKTRLNDNKENKEQILSILVNVLYGTLKALHPMMPFITDEIAAGFKKYIDGSQEFLINETYPAEGKYAAEYSATEEVTFLQDLITQVRTIRSQFNVHPAKNVDIFISSEDPGAERIINDYRRYINLLAKVENITLKDKNAPRPQKAATAVFGNTAVYIPLEGLIDFEKENARLAKELGVIETGIANRTRMLGNENFTKNAAPEQVAKAKEELAQMQLKSAQIKEAIAGLK